MKLSTMANNSKVPKGHANGYNNITMYRKASQAKKRIEILNKCDKYQTLKM